MDTLPSTLSTLLVVCCGGLCAVSVLGMGVLVLVGRAEIVRDLFGGLTGALTGRGDDAVAGLLDGDEPGSSKPKRKRDRRSVEDIRAEMDRRFAAQVGDDPPPAEGGASWQGPTVTTGPTGPDELAQRRQRRRRYSHDGEQDYLDEIDSFIDDIEL